MLCLCLDCRAVQRADLLQCSTTNCVGCVFVIFCVSCGVYVCVFGVYSVLLFLQSRTFFGGGGEWGRVIVEALTVCFLCACQV